MKIMKKNLILSLLFSLLLMVSGGLLIVVGKDDNTITHVSNAAAGGPNGLPAIVATSSLGATNPGGTLSVAGDPLAIDGKSVYQGITTGTKKIIFTVVAAPHHEVLGVSVIKGEFKSKVFTPDEIGEGVYSEAVVDDTWGNNFYSFELDMDAVPHTDCGEDAGNDCIGDETTCITHNPDYDLNPLHVLSDVDYQIEIEFALVSYTLTRNAKYFDGEAAPDLLKYFKANTVDDQGNPEAGTNVNAVKLGDTIALVNNHNPAVDTGVRFCYALMDGWYNLEIETGHQYSGTYIITFTSKFLTDYASNGTITVDAVFVKTFQVNVAPNISSSSFNDSMEVHAESPVIFTKDGYYKTFAGQIAGEWLDKGTKVSVVFGRNDYYIVNGHTETQYPYQVASYSNITISETKTVTIDFVSRLFELRVRAIDNNENPVSSDLFNWEANVTSGSTTGESTVVKVGDKLNGITWEEMLGFIDSNITIQAAIGNTRDALTFGTIDEAFLADYHKNGGLDIFVQFTKQAVLEVKLLDDKGSVRVWELDENDVPVKEITLDSKNSFAFEFGTRVRITAISNLPSIFILDQFTNLAVTNRDANSITFTMHDNVSTTVMFSSNALNLTSKTTNSGITFDKTQTYSVGQSVVFNFDVPSNHTIKGWKLNGKKYSNLGSEVSLSGNTLTVMLSAELLAKNPEWFELVDGNTVNIYFDHVVETGLKPAVLLGILIPSILVPIALLVLGTFFFINFKRQKLIKTHLTEQRHAKIVFDPGAYVREISEGKGGEITKEDVKKEMKKRREETKKKTAEPKAAPEPKNDEPKVAFEQSEEEEVPELKEEPELESATTVTDLQGCAILQDRTIVDAEKNVVANLGNDGRITDMSGQFIAMVNVDEGTVVDEEGVVLGIVTGDGTISLQKK